jgi:zinc protease
MVGTIPRLAFLALLALAASCAPPTAAADETSYRLENGLRVTLIPAPAAARALPGARIAVVVLYDIGEAHDPEGRAGFAHLIEHLWVTAAAGSTPARTSDAWFAAHDGQANAQTGRDYTVIAAIAPPDRLVAELGDAAARVAGIKVEPADLERELPRLRDELANMYGGIPGFAARNHAQVAIDPLPGGARRGGEIDQLAAIPVADIAARISEHYVPARARLVIAGVFEEESAREAIEKLFGPIPSREAPPIPAREAPPPRLGGRIDLPAADPTARVVARLWRAPDLAGPDAAPYLLLAARFSQVAPAHGAIPVFTPIDDPRVFGAVVTLAADESAESGLARIDRALDIALLIEGPASTQSAGRALEGLLALRPPLTVVVATNPYFVAFGAGRRAQLGLDRAALAEGIAAAGEGLGALRERILAPDRAVTVAILPPKPAEE